MDGKITGQSLTLILLLRWLPSAVIVTVLCLLIYGGVQQVWRMSADYPQVQMARDMAAQIETGAQPQALVSSATVDAGRSLAPFIIVYDALGNVITASVKLDGAVPSLPGGVLDAARSRGEDRVTWQPKPGVRLATIVEAVKGGSMGYILASRSLQETEERIDDWGKIALIAWLVGLVGSLLAVWPGAALIRRL